MGNFAKEFFADLNRRGHDPMLGKLDGTLRFELTSGKRTEHWIVTVSGGSVTAERREGDADVVIRVDETLFEHICAGKTNATAALLRGAYRVEGDLELVMHFHRVLPAPPVPDEVLTQAATGGDRRDR